MVEMAYQALSVLINQYLAMDPDSEDKLAALDGKVLKLVIKPLTLFFVFKQQYVNVQASSDQAEDAVLSGHPLAFIQLQLSSKQTSMQLFKRDLTLSGDPEFGQQVQALFKDLDIDWEEQLSKLIGDVLAHQVTSLSQRVSNFATHVQSRTQHHLTEYLQEESRQLPCREEVDDFCDDVDELRLRVDRLLAHHHQLETS